jgi:hypothetical protein
MTTYKNRRQMNSETELRRYMSLIALEDIAAQKQQRLICVDMFQDPFEGSVPKKQIDDQLPAFSASNAMLMGESMAAQYPGRRCRPPQKGVKQISGCYR